MNLRESGSISCRGRPPWRPENCDKGRNFASRAATEGGPYSLPEPCESTQPLSPRPTCFLTPVPCSA